MKHTQHILRKGSNPKKGISHILMIRMTTTRERRQFSYAKAASD